MIKTEYTKRRFKKDLIFLFSLAIAIYLARTPYLVNLIQASEIISPITILLSGLLFTSFLTTPIAIVALLILGQHHSPIYIALLGGVGAVLGDILLIKILKSLAAKEFPLLFLSSRLIGVIVGVYSPFLNHLLPKYITSLPSRFLSNEKKLFVRSLRSDFIRGWILPLVGAAIIASPLPDEIGIVLLGASSISYKKIIVIAFVFNTIGIFLIASSANLL